jgi:hypothetical protein
MSKGNIHVLRLGSHCPHNPRRWCRGSRRLLLLLLLLLLVLLLARRLGEPRSAARVRRVPHCGRGENWYADAVQADMPIGCPLPLLRVPLVA